MSRPVLLVFARRPAWGAVKTRLAAEVGRSEALRFHRTQLRALLRRLGRDSRWQVVLAVTPDHAAHSMRNHSDVSVRPQGRGDLGVRMARAAGTYQVPVIIVGSDIPGIRPAHVAKAFHVLGRDDVVFGPSSDGGYWLVGFANRRPLVRPLAGVRWSGPHALSDSCATIGSRRRIGLVDSLDDVDDANAWRRFRRADAG